MRMVGAGCKGYCDYFENSRKRVTEIEYAMGFKFCGKCMRGYTTSEKSCDCCGYNMRIHTRTNSSPVRKKIRQRLIQSPEIMISYV